MEKKIEMSEANQTGFTSVEMLTCRSGLSGRNLQEQLQINSVSNSKTDLIINWGCGTEYKVKYLPNEWLNKRESVDIAKNKLKTFEKLDECGISIPEYTTEEEAMDTDFIWYARDKLSSSKGEGIRILKPNEFPWERKSSTPLYTKQVKGDREYRIHVFMNNIIAISKKEMNPEAEVIKQHIKNHDNGWIFKNCDPSKVHDEALDLAISAVNALGLDFGAVDMVYDRTKRKGWVLEVNTAPGLEEGGSTYLAYINAFNSLLEEMPKESEERYDLCIKDISWDSVKLIKEVLLQNGDFDEDDVCLTDNDDCLELEF